MDRNSEVYIKLDYVHVKKKLNHKRILCDKMNKCCNSVSPLDERNLSKWSES